MKVVILLFFVLLLSYQIYRNLEEKEEPVPVPTQADTVSSPASVKMELPPDLPPSELGTNEAPLSPEEPVIETKEGTSGVQDIASGAKVGEAPPAPDPGSFLDVGSRGVPSDKGSLFSPSTDKGS